MKILELILNIGVAAEIAASMWFFNKKDFIKATYWTASATLTLLILRGIQ